MNIDEYDDDFDDEEYESIQQEGLEFADFEGDEDEQYELWAKQLGEK
jgi:hypothetical protein